MSNMPLCATKGFEAANQFITLAAKTDIEYLLYGIKALAKNTVASQKCALKAKARREEWKAISIYQSLEVAIKAATLVSLLCTKAKRVWCLRHRLSTDSTASTLEMATPVSSAVHMQSKALAAIRSESSDNLRVSYRCAAVGHYDENHGCQDPCEAGRTWDCSFEPARLEEALMANWPTGKYNEHV